MHVNDFHEFPSFHCVIPEVVSTIPAESPAPNYDMTQPALAGQSPKPTLGSPWQRTA